MKIDEEIKETRVAEVPVYLTYQSGTRRLFVATRQVFAPRDVEGTLPSSSVHRQMLTPRDVEGALPSSSTHRQMLASQNVEGVLLSSSA